MGMMKGSRLLDELIRILLDILLLLALSSFQMADIGKL